MDEETEKHHKNLESVLTESLTAPTIDLFADVSEAFFDEALERGIFREIPIVGAIIGLGKIA